MKIQFSDDFVWNVVVSASWLHGEPLVFYWKCGSSVLGNGNDEFMCKPFHEI